MPELPEVESIVRFLAPQITGATIESLFFGDKALRFPPPLDLPLRVRHQTIVEITRRGKAILMILSEAHRGLHREVHRATHGETHGNPDDLSSNTSDSSQQKPDSAGVREEKSTHKSTHKSAYLAGYEFLDPYVDPHHVIVIHLGMSGRLRLHTGKEARHGGITQPHTHVQWFLNLAPLDDLDHANISSSHLQERAIPLPTKATQQKDTQHRGRPFSAPKPRTSLPARLARLDFVDPRRFGFVATADTPHVRRLLSKLGSDPVRGELDPHNLHQRWQTSKRYVKDALLDQAIIAGVGNIYATEALWRAGISPQRRACDLTYNECVWLCFSVKMVLEEALASGGSTMLDHRLPNGEIGMFQHRWRVYGRQRVGEVCGWVPLMRYHHGTNVSLSVEHSSNVAQDHPVSDHPVLRKTHQTSSFEKIPSTIPSTPSTSPAIASEANKMTLKRHSTEISDVGEVGEVGEPCQGRITLCTVHGRASNFCPAHQR